MLSDALRKAAFSVAFMALLLLAGCATQVAQQPHEKAVEVDVKYANASTWRPFPADRPEMVVASLGLNWSERPVQGYLPAEVFAQLPPVPQDLNEISILAEWNMFSDAEFAALHEKYWKQPEFYPGFRLSGLELMQDPPEGRWGAYGMRGYPSDHYITVRQGDEFVSASFFTSSWLVQNRQAVSLVPRAVVNDDGKDGADAGGYFTLAVEPREFILGVAYPVFEKDWAQKVIVRGQVANGTPTGEYTIYMDLVEPSPEAAAKWEKEGRAYATPSFSGAADKPYYAIHMKVVQAQE